MNIQCESNTNAPRSGWQAMLYSAAVCSMLLMPFALSGCNTMEGAGEDVEAAGEAIEDAADDD